MSAVNLLASSRLFEECFAWVASIQRSEFKNFYGLKLKSLFDGLLSQHSKPSPEFTTGHKTTHKTRNPSLNNGGGFENEHGVHRTCFIRQFPEWISTRILEEICVDESFRGEIACCQEQFYVYWCISKQLTVPRSYCSKCFVYTVFPSISSRAQRRKLFNSTSQRFWLPLTFYFQFF